MRKNRTVLISIRKISVLNISNRKKFHFQCFIYITLESNCFQLRRFQISILAFKEKKTLNIPIGKNSIFNDFNCKKFKFRAFNF